MGISRYAGPPGRKRSIDDFTFVGSGRGAGDREERVSENHDLALAGAFASRRAARHK
ncbi:MAG TPA: hypothetical protein VNA04_14930 [Thermoanaerobaculia bacterium]|nr:hypothetical protein [Thermoanaerobaculia bacterium]